MVSNTKIAYLFPGQGAQYVGMAKSLYTSFPQARKVFEEANDILNLDVANLCFNGPEQELKKTKNAQCAIFVTSLAAARTFEEVVRQPLDSFIQPAAMAGLSLGELTALCWAGSIDFKDGLLLVSARGKYMDEAANIFPGGMLAIIGLSKDKAEEVCAKTGTYIANLNSPGQIVISGKLEDLEQAKSLSLDYGVRAAVMLDVSGAFHSPLMESAAERFAMDVNNTKFIGPKIPIISNVTAGYENNPEIIKRNLINQLRSPTLWEDSMRVLIADGITTFVEFAPGRVLAGLMKRIEPSVSVYNIETQEDIEKFNAG